MNFGIPGGPLSGSWCCISGLGIAFGELSELAISIWYFAEPRQLAWLNCSIGSHGSTENRATIGLRLNLALDETVWGLLPRWAGELALLELRVNIAILAWGASSTPPAYRTHQQRAIWLRNRGRGRRTWRGGGWLRSGAPSGRSGCKLAPAVTLRWALPAGVGLR